MRKFALALVSLALMTHGRRIQTSKAASERPLNALAMLLEAISPAAFNPTGPAVDAPTSTPTLAGMRPVVLEGQTRLVPVFGLAEGEVPKIIICGAPASGKGTQCELLKEKYGVVHLSTGDMLRAAVKEGTEVGLKAKGFMESGKLVPDDVIIGIVKDRLAEEDCEKCGWLLDGFPRTEEQAKALQAAGIEPNSVLYLDVPDEMLIERVVGRRTDPETGKIYHVKFFPPENDEIAKRLTQRADDTEEKVRVRLEAFHEHMGAVEAVYKDLISKTDGTKPKEEVFESLTKALD
mmetsp:Transcript_155721/g.283200  ORF Transcript_155721/g.283200 Transcript_155721/m.283200 type:complete len:292 (+) Transcript_155721:71-946(+)